MRSVIPAMRAREQSEVKQKQQKWKLPKDSVLDKRWRIVDRIGRGRFSEVFSACPANERSLDRNTELVAIKAEVSRCVGGNGSLLHREFEIMNEMKDSPYTCHAFSLGSFSLIRSRFMNHSSGSHGSQNGVSDAYQGSIEVVSGSSVKPGDYQYLVMELCSSMNLSDLRKHQSQGYFGPVTGALIGIEIIRALQTFHQAGWVHRDIKPSNFVRPLKGLWQHHLYLVDFGLSKRWRDRQSGEALPERERGSCEFAGTSLYASMNAHCGNDTGRCDDLWSAMFMIVDISCNSLPWKEAYSMMDKHYLKHRRSLTELMKRRLIAQALSDYPFAASDDNNNSESQWPCDIPDQFREFVRVLNGIGFADDPPYEHLVSILRSICKDERHLAHQLELDRRGCDDYSVFRFDRDGEHPETMPLPRDFFDLINESSLSSARDDASVAAAVVAPSTSDHAAQPLQPLCLPMLLEGKCNHDASDGDACPRFHPLKRRLDLNDMPEVHSDWQKAVEDRAKWMSGGFRFLDGEFAPLCPEWVSSGRQYCQSGRPRHSYCASGYHWSAADEQWYRTYGITPPRVKFADYGNDLKYRRSKSDHICPEIKRRMRCDDQNCTLGRHSPEKSSSEMDQKGEGFTNHNCAVSLMKEDWSLIDCRIAIQTGQFPSVFHSSSSLRSSFEINPAIKAKIESFYIKSESDLDNISDMNGIFQKFINDDSLKQQTWAKFSVSGVINILDDFVSSLPSIPDLTALIKQFTVYLSNYGDSTSSSLSSKIMSKNEDVYFDPSKVQTHLCDLGLNDDALLYPALVAFEMARWEVADSVKRALEDFVRVGAVGNKAFSLNETRKVFEKMTEEETLGLLKDITKQGIRKYAKVENHIINQARKILDRRKKNNDDFVNQRSSIVSGNTTVTSSTTTSTSTIRNGVGGSSILLRTPSTGSMAASKQTPHSTGLNLMDNLLRKKRDQLRKNVVPPPRQPSLIDEVKPEEKPSSMIQPTMMDVKRKPKKKAPVVLPKPPNHEECDFMAERKRMQEKVKKMEERRKLDKAKKKERDSSDSMMKIQNVKIEVDPGMVMNRGRERKKKTKKKRRPNTDRDGAAVAHYSSHSQNPRKLKRKRSPSIRGSKAIHNGRTNIINNNNNNNNDIINNRKRRRRMGSDQGLMSDLSQKSNDITDGFRTFKRPKSTPSFGTSVDDSPMPSPGEQSSLSSSLSVASLSEIIPTPVLFKGKIVDHSANVGSAEGFLKLAKAMQHRRKSKSDKPGMKMNDSVVSECVNNSGIPVDFEEMRSVHDWFDESLQLLQKNVEPAEELDLKTSCIACHITDVLSGNELEWQTIICDWCNGNIHLDCMHPLFGMAYLPRGKAACVKCLFEHWKRLKKGKLKGIPQSVLDFQQCNWDKQKYMEKERRKYDMRMRSEMKKKKKKKREQKESSTVSMKENGSVAAAAADSSSAASAAVSTAALPAAAAAQRAATIEEGSKSVDSIKQRGQSPVMNHLSQSTVSSVESSSHRSTTITDHAGGSTEPVTRKEIEEKLMSENKKSDTIADAFPIAPSAVVASSSNPSPHLIQTTTTATTTSTTTNTIVPGPSSSSSASHSHSAPVSSSSANPVTIPLPFPNPVPPMMIAHPSFALPSVATNVTINPDLIPDANHPNTPAKIPQCHTIRGQDGSFYARLPNGTLFRLQPMMAHSPIPATSQLGSGSAMTAPSLSSGIPRLSGVITNQIHNTLISASSSSPSASVSTIPAIHHPLHHPSHLPAPFPHHSSAVNMNVNGSSVVKPGYHHHSINVSNPASISVSTTHSTANHSSNATVDLPMTHHSQSPRSPGPPPPAAPRRGSAPLSGNG